MEYRHNASSARLKDWKLMCDPLLNARHTQKVYRYDGPSSGKSPERPRDPRDSRMNSWTSRREPADLPLPNLRYDEYYVGDPIEKEITFDNLNDNINRQNLLDMCKPFGVPEDAKVYFHPKTKKHLGIGKVVFRSSRAASECAQKLNNTSKMGNIMIVKVDTMGRERHALVQERINGGKRHPEAPPAMCNHGGGNFTYPHGELQPGFPDHPPVPNQFQPPPPAQPHHDFMHRHPSHQSGDFHQPHPPPPQHSNSHPHVEETPPITKREDPRLLLSTHHQSHRSHSSHVHPPPPNAHWSAAHTPPNGIDPIPKESTPTGRHSRHRQRHGRSRRSPREQFSPGHLAKDSSGNASSMNHREFGGEATLNRDGSNGGAGDAMDDRRDSSISNESEATGASASILQDSLGALMSSSGHGPSEEESLESRIQNLLKGTSLSSGVALGGITPSPGASNMPGSMFSFVSGESGQGAITPLSDEAMSDDDASANSGNVPMQPNTPPTPPSPGDASHMPFPPLPLSSTPTSGRIFLPPPGLPLPSAHPNSNRRTLLPTPPVVGGLPFLPNPETPLLPCMPPSSYMGGAPQEASPWPEACSDAALSEILQCLVDELKEVMKKDVSKRMIESCGFPAFHRWWNYQEKRASGSLYHSSVSPSKRHGVSSFNMTSSPGMSKPFRNSGTGPVTPKNDRQFASQFPSAPSAPMPATESESGFGSSLMDGENGPQTQSTAFAAIFENLKEGGLFFSGIRSALPKIKRKPRPPTPPREKANEKKELEKAGEAKDFEKSKETDNVDNQDEEAQKEKRSSSASSGVSSGGENVSPTRRRKRRVAAGGDNQDSDSGTSPAYATESEESESTAVTTSSSDESEEEDDEEEEEEEEEEETEKDETKETPKVEKSKKSFDTISSSELSESDAERERQLLEKQQSELIRRVEKKNQGRPRKPQPAGRRKAVSKAPQKKISKERISSLSSFSSSEDEPIEESVLVKKRPVKKQVERKRDSSLFEVFNSLLEGKQKTSTTLATPETLNQRRLTETKESESEKDESMSEGELEDEKMDEGEVQEVRKVNKRTKPPPNRRNVQKAAPKPVANRKSGRNFIEEELSGEDSLSSSESESGDEEDEDEEDEEEDEEEEDGELTASCSGMSQDEEAKDDSVADLNNASATRRRRKQDLYSPHTSVSPTKSSPVKSQSSTAVCEPESVPRARSASERLQQIKRGEVVSPLPPIPTGTPSSAGNQSSLADDEKDMEQLEDLDWLPEVGVPYEWPWEIQHDHSYCFEPNRDAMDVKPPSKPALDLMSLVEKRQSLKRKQSSKRRGGPAAKKQRSMQDITNRHRDRSNRGSRELASLFTPVEVKSLDRARKKEESELNDRRRDRVHPKAQKRLQRVTFKRRDSVAEQNILYDIFKHGIDAEDVKFLQMCYQKLLDQDNTGCSWLNDTHWVDHPVTHCPADSPRPLSRGRTRSKAPLSPEIPIHKTGSARTEGFYKLSRAQKYSALMAARNSSAEMLGPRGGDFPTNMNAGNTATGTIGMEEISSKKSKHREMRSEQRRLLVEFQDVETGDLLKFNQLKFRKKQLQFGRSGIHSWGLFALETIAAEEMVIEYVGQMVRKHVAEVREKKYEACGKCSSYLFRVDDEYVIDATMCGNFARFINHSCNPNCYAKVVTMEGAKKMVIYSRREILKFEEITYDYKFPYEEEKIPCLCGSSMCRGTLN